jgi:hypothetical protein
MLTKRANLIMLACLLIGILLGLFLGFKGGISIKTMSENAKKNSQGIAPLRILDITIGQSQRDELFDQLRKFAEKNAFAIRIAQVHPAYDNFTIDMWRNDIRMFGSYPSDPGTLSFGVYYTVQSQPVPESVFDEAIGNLEVFIDEIPKATITVK